MHSEYIVDFIDDTMNMDAVSSDDKEGINIENGRFDGRTVPYFGTRYERDLINRRLAIELHGLTCFGCGFNFGKIYGRNGDGFIEIHHLKPLSELDAAAPIDPAVDLVPLCANCHRMIHCDPIHCLTLGELKKMIRKKD